MTVYEIKSGLETIAIDWKGYDEETTCVEAIRLIDCLTRERDEARRKALEEAAAIVEAMSPTYISNGRRFLKETGEALDELAPHLEAQRVAKLHLQGKRDINEFERAAAAIRSLSPQGE